VVQGRSGSYTSRQSRTAVTTMAFLRLRQEILLLIGQDFGFVRLSPPGVEIANKDKTVQRSMHRSTGRHGGSPLNICYWPSKRTFPMGVDGPRTLRTRDQTTQRLRLVPSPRSKHNLIRALHQSRINPLT